MLFEQVFDNIKEFLQIIYHIKTTKRIHVSDIKTEINTLAVVTLVTRAQAAPYFITIYAFLVLRQSVFIHKTLPNRM